MLNSRLHRLLTCGWQGLAGTPFERFLGEVFLQLGYSVQMTGKTGDQGVDLIASAVGKRLAIQAKGYPGTTVGNHAIMEVHTGMTYHRCHACVVVTNSTFTARPAIGPGGWLSADRWEPDSVLDPWFDRPVTCGRSGHEPTAFCVVRCWTPIPDPPKTLHRGLVGEWHFVPYFTNSNVEMPKLGSGPSGRGGRASVGNWRRGA